MIAVKGIYQSGDIVKLNGSVPVFEPYEVVVTFLNPARQPASTEEKDEETLTRRQEGYRRFMQYRGLLSADFDYKKELDEYREERHGRIN